MTTTTKSPLSAEPRSRIIAAVVVLVVMVVPVVALHNVVPKVAGLAFVFGVSFFGLSRLSLGWKPTMLGATACVPVIIAATYAGRHAWSIIALVAFTAFVAGLMARFGWHTIFTFVPAFAAIYSGPSSLGTAVANAGMLWFGAVVGVVVLGVLKAIPKVSETPIGTEAAALFGLGLAILTGLSTGIARSIHLPHGYWATIAILAVVQPRLDVTKARTLGRSVGTIGGALVAVALTSVIHGHVWYVVFGTVMCAVAVLVAKSYGWKMFCFTMMVVFWDASESTATNIAHARVLDTVLAAVLVVIFSMVVPVVIERVSPEVRAQLGDTNAMPVV